MGEIHTSWECDLSGYDAMLTNGPLFAGFLPDKQPSVASLAEQIAGMPGSSPFVGEHV